MFLKENNAFRGQREGAEMQIRRNTRPDRTFFPLYYITRPDDGEEEKAINSGGERNPSVFFPAGHRQLPLFL